LAGCIATAGRFKLVRGSRWLIEDLKRFKRVGGIIKMDDVRFKWFMRGLKNW